MHVSRAVSSIRDDPVPDATVGLVLEPADDATADKVAARAREAGATVERTTQFDAVVVTATQDDVADLCALEGLASVRTTDAIGFNPDEVEEDVEDLDG